MADATTYAKILFTGNYDNYIALETKDPDVLYFCQDQGKLFKGAKDYTDAFVQVTSATLPAAGIPGKIYYETDTKIFKTYLGNAYVEIQQPIDQVGDSTTHTLSASSSDNSVPSSKNVWLYGQAIISEVIGGTDVIKDVTAGTDPASVTVKYGDNSTSKVTVPGVVTGITDDTTTDGQFIVTGSDGSTSAVAVSGVVTTPTWDETSLKLTLPVVGGEAIEVNIPKDIFLESGSYDITNKQIVLVLNDSSSTEIRFSVTDMVPIYDVTDTSTVDSHITWDGTNGKYVISADAKISAEQGNGIEEKADGLYLDVRPYATTTDLGTLEAAVATLEESHNNLAAAALQWGTF